MPYRETHILKFGGSSLRNPEMIQQAIRTVAEHRKQANPVVVVSALGGVTDALLELTNTETLDESRLMILRERHHQMINEIAPTSGAQHRELDKLFDELESDLRLLHNKNSNLSIIKDRILSVGERASARIMHAALNHHGIPSALKEAHKFIKTDSAFGEARVISSASRRKIQQSFKENSSVSVVTGFIGSDREGRITTLGRSGSDYTAGIIADALDAEHLQIWTDVNGVLSADPDWVPTAHSIDELSFSDIAELSAHGANVIHPKTILPIQNKETTITVKNSFNPTHSGTQIRSGFKSNGSLKTITINGPFVSIQIDAQYADDLFEMLRHWQPEAIQSEGIGYRRSYGYEPARFLISHSFYEKVKESLAEWTYARNIVPLLDDGLYKVKKFSNDFKEGEKLSARILNLLHKNGLKPINIGRKRDERFISFLFEKDDARRAARLMNDYLSDSRTIVNLFVAGTGAVGHTLLEQLKQREPDSIHFRLIGTCNSREEIWDKQGLDLESESAWADAKPTNWDSLMNRLKSPELHNLIFVDATGSEEVARLYPELLENDIHIVTPSKLANTFEQSYFDQLQTLSEKGGGSFRYETTVGAGLPIISTIQDLKASGDELKEISGVVSGTMTYLFNELEKGTPFSEATITASELGYAEPDPRDDLSGEDVARKFLTLARILGIRIDREELEVQSLIPEELQAVDKAEFLEKLHTHDDNWEKRLEKALQDNQTLRYTGQLKNGKIEIGIQSVPADSPLGQLNGTDNLIQIFSERYNDTPLVIQGPGAGKGVTAAGVLSDILKTAKLME